MRNRTEEINVRVFKTEKNLIRRKARKCGMNMSEYLRTLGTDATVKEAPREELMQAYHGEEDDANGGDEDLGDP